MRQIVYSILAFVLTYIGVEIFRRWTLRRQILDIPNERSSHKTPTPRGGGLILVIVTLTAYSLYSIFVTGNFSPGYLCGAVLIAAVSWYDDLRTISSGIRFLVHALAAGLAIYSLGFLDSLKIPFAGEIGLNSIGVVVTFLWIVWLTNAYNFMDGIDGIAAAQAFTAGIGWFMAGMWLNAETIGFYGSVIAFSSLGFLLHNWSPAKIFMGDVGSAFLGYTFAVFPLMTRHETKINDSNIGSAAVFFVWLFVFDTIYTFVRRLLRGEKVWQAHRSHLYQKMVIGGYSHRFVTTLYGVLSALILTANLLWLVKGEDFGLITILVIVLASGGTATAGGFKKPVDVN